MPESDLSAVSANATLLGFDFGQRKIGVAVGQRLTGTASPLLTLSSAKRQIDWIAIAELISEWQPVALIVGFPLTEEGEQQPATKAAERFANQLRGRFGLPVFGADERYTSREASERFANLRAAGAVKRRHGGNDDAVAAQLILERWMAEHTAPAH